MGIRMFFQLDSDICDEFLHLRRGFVGMAMRGFGLVLIPLRIPGLVSMEPFKEPWFGSSQLRINQYWSFPLQVLFYGHLSQSIFVHRLTSWVGFIEDIIKRFQPKGKRCIGTKTDIKGKRCSGTSG